MSAIAALDDIPGGKALLEWFGRIPRFHDAKMLEINFSGGGAAGIRIYAWNMTNEVDSSGYFVLENHAIVILTLEGVNAIECTDFDMVPGIIFDLEISRAGEYFRIEWSASYGVTGAVVAKSVCIDLIPGKLD